MSLRFSDDGPEFPDELVDDLLKGEVVFLCGAGVSAPQLPGFKQLVCQCFKPLNVSMNDTEKIAFKAERYEEVLGSLSRRIVDPSELTKVVSKEVQAPSRVNLSNHRTILRLSRDLENRPTIVTTNFDTLFERAVNEAGFTDKVANLSFAGQEIPAPGSVGFGGIIHIHGRIADEQIQLGQTPLVFTSADYGDAYLRSGWASRFFFDLVRCKTLVLVGYSAGDAPVRYLLNVLENDRERFPDLRLVYAFDGIDTDAAEAVARWASLAVPPLFYQKKKDSKKRHEALWNDLSLLADLIECPKATRRSMVQEILEKSFEETDDKERDNVSWLFNERSDLWGVAIRAIHDPDWFDFLADKNLWSNDDAAWVLAAWIARDFTDAQRFQTAIKWHNQKLSEEIARRLLYRESKQEVSDIWLRTWRLLTRNVPLQNADDGIPFYEIKQILAGPVVLRADIEKAVDLLSPRVKLSTRTLYGTPIPENPNRLADLAYVEITGPNHNDSSDLIEALLKIPCHEELVGIATTALRSAIGYMVDAELIGDAYDENDFSVPSIEKHPQNNHRDGVRFLVRLLVGLLPLVAKTDPEVVRRYVEEWKNIPGRIGKRLSLHAFRDEALFTANEALNYVLSLSEVDFWIIRRELALVLRDRAGTADEALVREVEERIISEGDRFFQRYSVEEGQPDWRPYARDRDVWLLLNMMAEAIVISEIGQTELEEIKARRAHLKRKVECRDFFSSYTSGVRTVTGDAKPILEADEDDKLRVAHELMQSPDIEKQEGWNTYCRSDPKGALNVLKEAPLELANTRLWQDLISALYIANEEERTKREHIVIDVFQILESAKNDFILNLLMELTQLYRSTPRKKITNSNDWWTRLFELTSKSEIRLLDAKQNFYGRSINSPSGHLTEALLLDVEECHKAARTIPEVYLNNLITAATSDGSSGTLARAPLVHNAAFLLSVIPEFDATPLVDALSGDDTESAGLRAVLVTNSSTTLKFFQVFSSQILRGAREFDGSGHETQTAASKILLPLVYVLLGNEEAKDCGITKREVIRTLREGSNELRVGAVQCLSYWVRKLRDRPAEKNWRDIIGLLHDAVWPRERRFRDCSISQHFGSLAVGAGDAFPEALEQLLPYLVPLTRYGSIHDIEQSKAPDKHPHETLKLLWILCGPKSNREFHEMPKVLNRLIEADPSIETDRRFQWLEQNTTRFE